MEKKLGPEATKELVGKYSTELSGARLAEFLREVSIKGDREVAADFFIEVLQGPPVAAQLLVIRVAEKAEWRKIPRLDSALTTYLSDFDSLTQAFSYYQDRAGGCKGKCGR